jgi:glycosyltransferase involved in cell wall biosynthesis
VSRNLRIIHCLRAPVGGLFRHVVDLASEQAALGHHVGIIYDKSTEAPAAASSLAHLHTVCSLGVRSISMPRLPGPYDLSAYHFVKSMALETQAQILHGHGAKGGAYARFAAARLRKGGHKVYGFYTPHGGSLHYAPCSLSGRLFLGLERKLARLSSGLIFESVYSANKFQEVIGKGFCPVQIAPNGVGPADFEPDPLLPSAASFLFIGELRLLKGVDVLLEAMASLRKAQPSARLAIVGDGPDMDKFINLTDRLGLGDAVTFHGRLPAQQAFTLGEAMVMPSRAESFPYVILEAGAAGKPMVLTDVGGIPEIIDGTGMTLLPAGDSEGLSAMMNDFMVQPEAYQQRAGRLRARIADKFTIEKMAAQVTDFYLAVMRR